MLLLGVPIVGFFAVVYARASGCSMRDSFVRVYTLLYDISFNPDEEPNPLSAITANIVFLFGIFVFALIVGGISEEVKEAVDRVRAGKYPVNQTDHVLVLNWNSQTIPLLEHIVEARASYKRAIWDRPVVIMAERPKADMDAEIVEAGLHLKDFEYYTREGDPLDLDDLERVKAAEANKVIVMEPADVQGLENAEAMKTATSVALAATGVYDNADADVVVQCQWDLPKDADTLHCFMDTFAKDAAARLHLLELPDNKIVYRHMSCTASQPGLINVWKAILEPSDSDVGLVFTMLPRNMAGLQYKEVRQRFALSGVLWGFTSAATGELMLSPPDNTVMALGDKLVLLARPGPVEASGRAPAIFTKAQQAAQERISSNKSKHEVKPQHFIVAGWKDDDVEDLLEGLASFTPPGSSVVFNLTKPLEAKVKIPAGMQVRFFVTPQPSSPAALEKADIRRARSVIVGGLEELSAREADARVLAALVQVDAAAQSEGCKDHVHVVAQIRNAATADVAAKYLEASQAQDRQGDNFTRPDLVHLDSMVSALLSQVAYQPDCRALIDQLLVSAEGFEIYLRPTDTAFNMQPGEVVSFAEATEAARLVNEVALGWICANSNWISLVPRPEESHVVQPGDRLITLAADFKMQKYVPGEH